MSKFNKFESLIIAANNAKFGIKEITTSDEEEIFLMEILNPNTLQVEDTVLRINGVQLVYLVEETKEVENLPAITIQGFANLLAATLKKTSGMQAKGILADLRSKFPDAKPHYSVVKQIMTEDQIHIALVDAKTEDLISAILKGNMTPEIAERSILLVNGGLTPGGAAAKGKFVLGRRAIDAAPGFVLSEDGETVHSLVKGVQKLPARMQLMANLETLVFDNEDLIELNPVTGVSGAAQLGVRLLAGCGASEGFVGGAMFISETAATKYLRVRNPIKVFEYNGKCELFVEEGDLIEADRLIANTPEDGDILWNLRDSFGEDVVVTSIRQKRNRVSVVGYYARPIRTGDKARFFTKATIVVKPDSFFPVIEGEQVHVLFGGNSSGKNPAYQLEMAGWTGAVLPEDWELQNEAIEAMPRAELQLLGDEDVRSEFRFGKLTMAIEGPGIDSLCNVKDGMFPHTSVTFLQYLPMTHTLRAFHSMQRPRREAIISLIAASFGQMGKEELTLDFGLRRRIEEFVVNRGSELGSSAILEDDILMDVAGEHGALLAIGKHRLAIPSAAAIKEFLTYSENRQPKLNKAMVIARQLLADIVAPGLSGVYDLGKSLDRYYRSIGHVVKTKNLVGQLLGWKAPKMNGRIGFSTTVPRGGIMVSSDLLKKANFPKMVLGSRTPTIVPGAIQGFHVYENHLVGGSIMFNVYDIINLMNADADGDQIALLLLFFEMLFNGDMVEDEVLALMEMNDDLHTEFVASHYKRGENTKLDDELEDASTPVKWGVTWYSYAMEDVRRSVAFASASQRSVGMATQVTHAISLALVKAMDKGLMDQARARKAINALSRSIQNALDGMKHIDISEALDRVKENGGFITANLGKFDRSVQQLIKLVDRGNIVDEKDKDYVRKQARIVGIQLSPEDLDIIVECLGDDDVALGRKLLSMSTSSSRFNAEDWNDAVKWANTIPNSGLVTVNTFKQFAKEFASYVVPQTKGDGRGHYILAISQAIVNREKAILSPALMKAVACEFLKKDGRHDMTMEGISDRINEKADKFKGLEAAGKTYAALALAVLLETGSRLPLGERVRLAYAIEPRLTGDICRAADAKVSYVIPKTIEEEAADFSTEVSELVLD